MKPLIKFLSKQHVLSLATSSSRGTYNTPLFYHFDRNNFELIFQSSALTNHFQQLSENRQVSFSVYVQTMKVLQLKGVQGIGQVIMDKDQAVLAEAYFTSFPFARAICALNKYHFMSLRPEWIKFTNNSCGFGTKQEYTRLSAGDMVLKK